MGTNVKLVGAATFNSRSTGKMVRDQIKFIEDDEVADRLLEKGTEITDGDGETFLKPLFVEVAAREAARANATPAKPPVATQEQLDDLAAKNEELTRRLAAANAAQAPVGQGPNQAEVTDDMGEVDSEEDGAHDEAYHEPNAGSEGVLKASAGVVDPSDVDAEQAQEESESSEEQSSEEAPAKPATKTVSRQRATTGKK